MAKALFIPADLDAQFCFTRVDTLQDYQQRVGGYIEAVPIKEHPATTVFINEEGKLEGLPLNRRATEILRNTLRNNDAIVGNAVIVNIDEEGESVDIDRLAADYCIACCIRTKAVAA